MRSKETKMLKTLTAAALALTMLVAPACAETYNYACKVSGVEPNPNNTYLYSAKIDTTKNTITWRDTVYKNDKRTFKVDGEECAKLCFGNNKIMLSTATRVLPPCQLLLEPVALAMMGHPKSLTATW